MNRLARSAQSFSETPATIFETADGEQRRKAAIKGVPRPHLCSTQHKFLSSRLDCGMERIRRVSDLPKLSNF